MSAATLDRVRIRCRAPTAKSRQALELNRRLVTAARLHLPRALELALEDLGERRLFVDSLDVPLDFDPRDYDDVTVATLWAGRIARALAGIDGSESGVRVFADTPEFVAGALSSVVDHGSLGPLFAELGVGAGPIEPAPFLARFDSISKLRPLLEILVADEQRACRLYGRLRARERRSIVAALRGRSAWGSWLHAPARRSPPGAESPDEASKPGSEKESGEDATMAAAAKPRATHAIASRAEASGSEAETTTAASWLAAIRSAAGRGATSIRFDRTATAYAKEGAFGAAGLHSGSESAPRQPEPPPRLSSEPLAAGGASDEGRLSYGLREAPPSSIDSSSSRATDTRQQGEDGRIEGIAWWSLAGGLVLLYPWLLDFLSEPPPRLAPAIPNEQVAGRLWALAALVCDDPESLLLDATVRVLAGDDPAIERIPTAIEAEIPPGFDEARDRVLSSFASTLPGLSGSSAAYLRRWFLRRGALVEPLADGSIRVRLERGPLDPLLEFLPYPLASFRLRWTVPVTVELRRDLA